jgi:hypothetical protein
MRAGSAAAHSPSSLVGHRALSTHRFDQSWRAEYDGSSGLAGWPPPPVASLRERSRKVAYQCQSAPRPGPSQITRLDSPSTRRKRDDLSGDSVAVGPPLAGLLLWRRSCFSHHGTDRDRFRSPAHPVKRVHVPECGTGRPCRPQDASGRQPMHTASEPTERWAH